MRGRPIGWGTLVLGLCLGGAWLLTRSSGDPRAPGVDAERSVTSDAPDEAAVPALAGAPKAGRRPSESAGTDPRASASTVEGPGVAPPSAPTRTGAVVATLTGPGARSPMPEIELRLVGSDGRLRTARTVAGSARFEDVPAGEAVVTLRSASIVGGAAPFAVTPDAGTTTVKVNVEVGAPVTGWVRDAATSEPIPHARVAVCWGGSYGGVWTCESGAPPVLETVSTDGEGRFATSAQCFDQVLTLDVVAAGHARARVATRLQPSEGERPPLEVRLGLGGSVHGRVVDAAGAPLAGVDVLVFGAAWTDQRRDPRAYTRPEISNLPPRSAFEGLSDAEGRFVVDGVPFGTDWCATALATGNRRAKDVCGVAVAAGVPAPEVTLVLPAGGTLEVRLLDPGRRPVTTGVVTLEDGPSARPDASGVARFQGLAAGTVVVATALDEFVPTRTPVRIRENETASETIVLRAGSSLSGVVVDTEGAPVPGIWVGATRPASRVTPEVHVDTDALGAFRIGGLAREPYQVSAMGFRVKQDGSLRVTPPAEHLRIVVRRPPTVTARLVLPAGTAAPTEVQLSDLELERGGGSGNRLPWSDGPISFVVQPGRRRLTWSVEGCAPVDREVTVPESGNLALGDVVLDVGVSLEGDVVDGSGRPVAGAEVRRPEEWGSAIQVPADGRFRFEHLRRGKVTIGVHAPGFVPRYVPRDLAADASPLHVVLERGGVVRGRAPRYAADADGSARLLSPSSPEGAAAYDRLDADGAFELRAPAGRYVLEVSARGRPTLRRDVVLTEGSEETVDLDASK